MKRWIASLLSITLFFTQVLLAHSAEVNFWEQRRLSFDRHSRESGNPGLKPSVSGKVKHWVPAFAGTTAYTVTSINYAFAFAKAAFE